jgi:hypothetical protein
MANSMVKSLNIKLGPCTSTGPIIEKKTRASPARARFHTLQFKGSRGELLGTGRLSTRPSEVMRKTLPEKSVDSCRDEARDDIAGAL